jgi:ABC-2 type transport system permease protein
MRQTLAIFKREMRSYFTSPIAYGVLTVFLVLSGYFFDTLVVRFYRIELFYAQQAQMYRQPPPPMNINELIVRDYFGIIVFIVALFLAPMLSMRLFSEEKRSGTMEVLLTSPITDWQIVLGKYLAGVALYAVMLAVSFLHIMFLFLWGKPDLGPILAGYLGLLLIGGAYLALGLFFSSLTQNQIVAGVISFAMFLLLYVIGWSGQFVGETLGHVLEYVSFITHYQDFEKGVVDTKDILFFATFVFFGLFLTLRSVESLKWRG